MKMIESLDFVCESEEFFHWRLGIAKHHVRQALNGIHATVNWIRTSIFRSIVDDLTVYISDEPINFPGELVIDDEEEMFQPIIYINIMTIAEDYKNREYLLEMKSSQPTCFEYAVFICLHELGHLFHGLIGGKGQEKRSRLLDYFNRGDYFYDRFISKMKNGDTYAEKKQYRNIPQEKAADRFARQYLEMVLKDRGSRSRVSNRCL